MEGPPAGEVLVDGDDQLEQLVACLPAHRQIPQLVGFGQLLELLLQLAFHLGHFQFLYQVEGIAEPDAVADLDGQMDLAHHRRR